MRLSKSKITRKYLHGPLPNRLYRGTYLAFEKVDPNYDFWKAKLEGALTLRKSAGLVPLTITLTVFSSVKAMVSLAS